LGGASIAFTKNGIIKIQNQIPGMPPQQFYIEGAECFPQQDNHIGLPGSPQNFQPRPQGSMRREVYGVPTIRSKPVKIGKGTVTGRG
jgi:hypothetical protein